MSFSTTTELAQLVEKELGHNVSGSSSQRADIVSHLDRAHKIILGGGGILNYNEKGQRLHENIIFPFARSLNPKILTLTPAITNVTATATRLSNTVTLNAAPDGSNSVANSFIRINSEPEIYKISTHTGGSTSLVLDGSYVGPSNLTAAECKIFNLQYTVGSSDILQLMSPFRVFSSQSEDRIVSIVDKDELLKNVALTQTTEHFPEHVAVVKESLGTLTVQFDSYPSDLARAELDYIPIPATLDTASVDPILPVQHRLTIAYLATYLISIRNNDNRAELFLSQARQEFQQLVDWNRNLMSGGDDDYGRLKISGFKSKKRVATVKGYTISN